MTNSEFFSDVKHRLDTLKKKELQGIDIYARERFYDSSFYESKTEGEMEKNLKN